MQLLFPKPNAAAAMINEAMMPRAPWLMNPNEQYFQPKFQHAQQIPSNFNMPPVFNQRMQMVFGTRTRRRRSNHSLVATMDPVAVARRNERERNRVKQVNDGFDALKKRVPFLPDKKKLSKVEILRYAMMYIRDLKDIVDEYDHNNTNSKTRKNSEGSTGEQNDSIADEFSSNSDGGLNDDFCDNAVSVVDDFLFNECAQASSMDT